MDKATPTLSPASVDSVMALNQAVRIALTLQVVNPCQDNIDKVEAAESALRAEVERLAAQAAPTEPKHHRWNIERDGADILICFNTHEKCEPCEYERFAPVQSQAPVVQATSEPQTWHDLKADPDAWDAVAAGIKTHEIRLDDRDFAVGDGLRLRKTRYTGHEMRTLGKPLEYIDQPIERIVSHIQRGYGLDPGWCILSFADRASSGATTAQAVRMLTREELNDVALSDQVGWGPGEYVEAVQRKFAEVNGLRIPADGKIGDAA